MQCHGPMLTKQTQLIQEALAACGWADAKLLEQQDTSEAFAFITETLQLPLLTLQVDLFHQGKGDKGEILMSTPIYPLFMADLDIQTTTRLSTNGS